MRTRETYLQDVVAQLLKLNYEITLMKFKVEKAMPEIMRECHCHVKFLRDQYRDVETQIKSLEEEQGETWVDLCPSIDRGLQDLSEAFNSVGNLVRMRLSEEACFPVDDLPGAYHDDRIGKDAARAPRVKYIP